MNIVVAAFTITLSVLLIACGGNSKNNSPAKIVSSTSLSSHSSSASLSSQFSSASFSTFSSSSTTSDNPILSCITTPANSQASINTKQLFRYLAALSCGQKEGVISGQNAGHGNQIIDTNSTMGYQHNIQPIIDAVGYRPAILGIDYEHDEIFTAAELTVANNRLIQHARQGGIVTITWSPLSPWLNAGDDPINKPGSWKDTRTAINATFVDMKELVNPNSNIRSVWLTRLDQMAAALTQLQDANVTVLWRPMQEMNATHFWWGMTSPLESAKEYVAVWQDMYRYFTETKKLNNLLWVYSPQPSILLQSGAPRDLLWAYPGDEFVDIIAPTTYASDLSIRDYQQIHLLHKPLAMAEYGPSAWEPNYTGELPAAAPTFDASLYAKRLLNDYPRIAYWVSWHSYYYDATHIVKLSLGDSKNIDILFNEPQVISLENLNLSENN
jgi:mannan endo-1,4-beta-mannosidase